MPMTTQNVPKIIIVGAGFGGLFAAKTLAGQPVEVLLIDRQNYHTFTPLLYQVATSALDPGEIAYPIRRIFTKYNNVQCLMGEVTAIHPDEKTIEVKINGEVRKETYDDLIIATGSKPDYYGSDTFRSQTFDLRTLEDAVKLRNHILLMFERAAWITESRAKERLLNFVVVGGGPTGLETAGALYELLTHVLTKEYHDQGSLSIRIHLVEKSPTLLAGYPRRLQQSALEQIVDLGVNVILDNGVEEIDKQEIRLEDGKSISTETVVWTAGVRGNSPRGIAGSSSGKIAVQPTLESKEYPHIYSIGDTACISLPEGKVYPMVIPVAQQQGVLAAKNILRHHGGQSKVPFIYKDRGFLATIGRKRAVAWVYNRFQVSGFLAWIAWLLLHLITLIGFRNKLAVLFSWIWSYFTYDRSVRIILD